jgi:flagellar basal-body rod protein FlgB
MDVLSYAEKALNVRVFNHKVLAGNIAHVETPNYKEKEVDFKQALEGQIAGVKNIEIQEKTESDGVGSVDGNTVNMEVQMVKMNENSMMYNALIQAISRRFSLMRYLITEGKR